METNFLPAKRNGTWILGVLLLVFLAASLLLIYSASQDPVRSSYLLKLACGIALWVPLLFCLKRMYELRTMTYRLSRSALTLRWGVRQLVFPMDMIRWARSAADFEHELPIPFFSFPGCILGRRKIAGLGETRFLAVDKKQMILIALPEGALVISPQDREAFIRTYEKMYELGSPEKVAYSASGITDLWNRVWQDQTAKRLLVASLAAVLLLWVFLGILMASLRQVMWVSLEIVPANRLILLGVLGSFVWAGNLLLGVYLYLQEQVQRGMVYLLWGASLLSILILIAAAAIMSF